MDYDAELDALIAEAERRETWDRAQDAFTLVGRLAKALVFLRAKLKKSEKGQAPDVEARLQRLEKACFYETYAGLFTCPVGSTQGLIIEPPRDERGGPSLN